MEHYTHIKQPSVSSALRQHSPGQQIAELRPWRDSHVVVVVVVVWGGGYSTVQEQMLLPKNVVDKLQRYEAARRDDLPPAGSTRTGGSCLCPSAVSLQ